VISTATSFSKKQITSALGISAIDDEVDWGCGHFSEGCLIARSQDCSLQLTIWLMVKIKK